MRLQYSVNYQPASKFAKFGKKQGERAWMNFENIINDPDNGVNDKTLLTNKFGGRLNGDAVAFSTEHPEDANDKNTDKIIEAYKFLLKTGRYEMPPLDQMLMELQNVKQDRITPQDTKEVEKSTDDMYVEFMQKLEDPKIQMLLKSIGQYYLATSAYGWRLSADNVVRIFAQNPDATFLQTRWQWNRKFNRIVNSGARRIVVMVPKHRKDIYSEKDPTAIRQAMDDARI